MTIIIDFNNEKTREYYNKDKKRLQRLIISALFDPELDIIIIGEKQTSKTLFIEDIDQ